MNNVIKRIEIDLYSPTSYEVIKAQQGDNKSRIIEFVLYNQGNPYTISDNIHIMLEGHRGDNSSFPPKECAVKNNIITVILDSDILCESGIAEAKIVMYDISNDSILSTIPFKVHVQKNPCDKNKLESEKHSVIDWLILNFEKMKITMTNVVSDLANHLEDNIRHITSKERSEWYDAYDKRHTHPNKNVLDDTTANYTSDEKTKLEGIQSGAEVNVQSDWNITDSDLDSYIKNKPSVYTKNEIDNKFSTLETNIDWKESVETFDDISVAYPNPQDGWTVNTKDTDYTYRYNGTGWVAISVNAIPKATDSVDGLLSKEDHINYEDANSKKHSHPNKSVLDKITQILLDNWNAAYTHVSDTLRHITLDERTLWNTVSNKVDKVEGKGLSTNDYTDEEKNILANISEGCVTSVNNQTGDVAITPANIGALPNIGGVHSISVPSGFTSANFVKICKVKPGANYQNQPILFHVIQRSRNGVIKLQFANGTGTQNNAVFECSGNIVAYIKLLDNYEWHIYLGISENYDNISVTQIEKGSYMSGTTITWLSECLTELPTGYLRANLMNNPGLSVNRSIVACKLGRGGDANSSMTFYWQSKNEQPTWLWGGHDGTSMYVFSPDNIKCGKTTSIIGKYNKNNILDTPYINVTRLGTDMTADEKYKVAIQYNEGSNNYFSPYVNGALDLGYSGKKWGQIYSTNSVIATSDKNEKKDISELDEEKAVKFIMGLEPKSFKFINGESGRTHTGLIAQDVEELLKDLDMSTLDFAGYIKSPKTRTVEKEIEHEVEKDGEIVVEKSIVSEQEIIEGEYIYGLRYEEFISPLIKMVQIQQEKISLADEKICMLESENAELKSKIENIESALEIIQNNLNLNL